MMLRHIMDDKGCGNIAVIDGCRDHQQSLPLKRETTLFALII